MRININIDDDMLGSIDAYARKMDINRTSAIKVLCSQALQAQEASKSVSELNEMLKRYEAVGVLSETPTLAGAETAPV